MPLVRHALLYVCQIRHWSTRGHRGARDSRSRPERRDLRWRRANGWPERRWPGGDPWCLIVSCRLTKNVRCLQAGGTWQNTIVIHRCICLRIWICLFCLIVTVYSYIIVMENVLLMTSTMWYVCELMLVWKVPRYFRTYFAIWVCWCVIRASWAAGLWAASVLFVLYLVISVLLLTTEQRHSSRHCTISILYCS